MNPDRRGLDPAYFVACLIALVAIAVPALLIGAIINQDQHVAYRIAPTTSPARCEEDMPCWDPATMGNHQGYVCFAVLSDDGSWQIEKYYDSAGVPAGSFAIGC